MTHVLELVGVRKVFRSDLLKANQVAIDDLTCRFGTGLCTGLLGHNGAGKTTTIRMILGLIRPDAGEIRFEDKPLTTDAKRVIGYMPEVNKLPGALTPEEILHRQLQFFAPEGLGTGAARRKAVDDALKAVGLAQHRTKRIGHLSKGMARRLAWAQATIHKPRLLILDEPASGLDPEGRHRLLGLIGAEKGRGTSILLCSHDLGQVSALCDEAHVLRRGKLVRDGRVADVADERYKIHVSGVDEAALKKVGDENGLPPFQACTREGFVSVLVLTNYDASCAWLKALLAKGFVIVKFGDSAATWEDELLPYFEGEDL